MVIGAAQYIVPILYTVAPLLALGYGVYARVWQQRTWPLASFIFSCLAGGALGVGIIAFHRWLTDGDYPTGEYVRAMYLSVAALCMMKFVDHWLLREMYLAMRVRLDRFGRPLRPNQLKAVGVVFVQRMVMLALVVTYVFALLLAYRPKQALTMTPGSGDRPMPYRAVVFEAADGVSLSGWWIPAGKVPTLLEVEEAGQWGSRSVLLCHGVGANKAHYLELARTLSERGFNVFAFDFRGHGQSAGNFVTYGDRERFDVLGAARWVRQNHAGESTRLFGVGHNMGAAALMGAAAEPEVGEMIDGLILYEPFARFETVTDAAGDRLLPGAVDWLVDHLSIPLAGLHGGSDLDDFAPVETVNRLWPRPVLVVHGQGETFVPTLQTMEVFQAASYPKEQFWPADNYYQRIERQRRVVGDGNAATLAEMFREFLGVSETLSGNAGVLHRTLRFLRESERAPVI